MNDPAPTKKNQVIAEALTKESDRGCVILSAALLDEALEELLRSVCRQLPEDVKATVDPLFQGYAPLATFSAKIQVAFALGVLPRGLRDKIEVIRRMRNDVAHEWGTIDFDEPRFDSRLKILFKRSKPETNEEEVERPVTTGLLALASTKEQLVTRIALALAVTDILASIATFADMANRGRDIRLYVRVSEAEGYGVGPA